MRIGAVSYLNTKPLVHGLPELAPDHELILDLPSRLADELAAGRLDVALIPSVEYFQNPDYTIVSDACIACRGPVRSVKLLSRVPLPEVSTLALDEGSRTSAVLARVLLKQQFGVEPQLLPFPIDAPPQSIHADALLMIGDRAMRRPEGDFVVECDLGDAWRRWTGLPFVFAMWVARNGTEDGGQGTLFAELETALARARDSGVKNVASIAAAEHSRTGLSYDDCLKYLKDQLHFFLGPQERAGLELFREYADKMNSPPISGVKKKLAAAS
jgi:chorismate dehydratase